MTADGNLVATSILSADVVEKRPSRKLAGRMTPSFSFISITVLAIPTFLGNAHSKLSDITDHAQIMGFGMNHLGYVNSNRGLILSGVIGRR